MADDLQFRGDLVLRNEDPHPKSPSKPKVYICSHAVKEAVNLSLYLRRPLLLEGEPGCGKTVLPEAVAYELGLPIYRWFVNSTSVIKEGFYVSGASSSARAKAKVTLGPVGKAYSVRDRPAVLLIDEVDRAYTQFPSDLLTVLRSPWSFPIVETGEVVTASHVPIIVMTNNQTKDNLDEAFLRTCVYCYIQFPSREQLVTIVEAVHPGKLPREFVESAVARFLELRLRSGSQQKPGIGELLDWVDVLSRNFGEDLSLAEQLNGTSTLPYYNLLLNAATLDCPDTARLLKPRARAILRQRISDIFDLAELGTLCFDLGINSIDSIAGRTLEEKAREVIAYFERRGRVSDLFNYLRQNRPNIDWDDLEEPVEGNMQPSA